MAKDKKFMSRLKSNLVKIERLKISIRYEIWIEDQLFISSLRISNNYVLAIFPSPFLSMAAINCLTYCCDTCLFLPRLLKASFMRLYI